MTPQLPARPNRVPLLAAAGLGGIVLGLVALRLFSGDGGDVDVATAPQAARASTSSTTLPATILSTEATTVSVDPRDPFGQIVTVSDATEGGAVAAAQRAPAAQPTQAAQRSQVSLDAPATTTATTTTATTTPAPATAPAQAVQAPPAALVPAVSTYVPPAPTAVPTTLPTPAPTPPPNPVPVAPPPPPVTARFAWGTVGPVAVPQAPVNVCVVRGTSACSSTRPATSVILAVAATIDPAAATAPTVLPAVCSNGGGAALLVNTGSAGTTIYLSVAVTVDGTPTIVRLSLPAPPDQSVVLSACAVPGTGAPSPANPDAPASPPPPSAGGLVNGVLPPLPVLLG